MNLQQVIQLVTKLINHIPVGTLNSYLGINEPEGWLICDGRELVINVYPELFNVIGAAYGGNGVTHFKLPDLRGRVIVAEGHGTNLSNRVLGSKFGEETHILTNGEMPLHNHSGNTGNHSIPHNHVSLISRLNKSIASPGTNGAFYLFDQVTPAGGVQEWVWPNGPVNPGPCRKVSEETSVPHTHAIESNGSNEPHNNMQPSFVAKYIIKYKNITLD